LHCMHFVFGSLNLFYRTSPRTSVQVLCFRNLSRLPSRSVFSDGCLQCQSNSRAEPELFKLGVIFVWRVDSTVLSSLIHVSFCLCCFTLVPDPVVFGWLQTTFAGVQLIGGPLIGRVVDVKGVCCSCCLSTHFIDCTLMLYGNALTHSR